MARAILSGAKTQTRRVIKVPPSSAPTAQVHGPHEVIFSEPEPSSTGHLVRVPYQVGGRLWVRENLRLSVTGSNTWCYSADDTDVKLRADDHKNVQAMRAWAHHNERTYCPSIHTAP